MWEDADAWSTWDDPVDTGFGFGWDAPAQNTAWDDNWGTPQDWSSWDMPQSTNMPSYDAPYTDPWIPSYPDDIMPPAPNFQAGNPYTYPNVGSRDPLNRVAGPGGLPPSVLNLPFAGASPADVQEAIGAGSMSGGIIPMAPRMAAGVSDFGLRMFRGEQLQPGQRAYDMYLNRVSPTRANVELLTAPSRLGQSGLGPSAYSVKELQELAPEVMQYLRQQGYSELSFSPTALPRAHGKTFSPGTVEGRQRLYDMIMGQRASPTISPSTPSGLGWLYDLNPYK